MKVVAHPDPFVLERSLLDGVAEAKRTDPLAAVLVVVPTARLGSHLQRRLAADAERRQPGGGGYLGIDILHHRDVVRRVLEGGPGPLPRLLPAPVLEELLGAALGEQRDGRLARYLKHRPHARSALMGTLRDLRKANLAAGVAAPLLRDDPRAEELAEVYSRFESLLDALAVRGLVDEAGLTRRAIEALGAGTPLPWAEVFHHGAYELIGVHRDLLLALGATAPLTVLLPSARGLPATAFADGFARRHLGMAAREMEAPAVEGAGLLGDRLALLYDEPKTVAPLGGGVELATVQGAAAEAEAAARGALAAVREGVPPEEIAILARSLEPYAAPLEAAFEALEREAVPGDEGRNAACWSSSLSAPLGRDRRVHDLLRLLRAVDDGFPRAVTAEVLASPRIRWHGLPGMENRPPRGDLAERWSREAGLLDGLEEWTERLPHWAGTLRGRRHLSPDEETTARRRARRRVDRARHLGQALESLLMLLEPAVPRPWPSHAERLEKLWARALREPGEGERESARLAELLDAMRLLESLPGGTEPVAFHAMVDWLDRAVAGTSVRVHGAHGPGVRVLDFMQARGLTFRRVFLMGFHDDLFPRRPRPDPFLDDESRARLRESTGKPLPVKREGDLEERQLLTQMLGSAGEGIHLLWQRADEGGRSKTPSLMLREVARVVLGRPDLGAPPRLARALATSPHGRLEQAALDPGLLAPGEAVLLEAFRARGPAEASRQLEKRHPGLGPGLRMLEVVERVSAESSAHGTGSLAFDGQVDRPLDPGTPLSVSALQVLGRCPLQFFFRWRLGVRELDEEATPLDLDAGVRGRGAHRLLELVHQRLRDEGLLCGERREDAAARAEELPGELWDEAFEEWHASREGRLPVLWGVQRELWLESLTGFVREDVERLLEEDWASIGIEEERMATLDLGQGVSATITGRFDRVARRDDAVTVWDFKTGGKLAGQVNPTTMLKGLALQVPLYGLMAGPGARVELLGVGPGFDPESTEERDRRASCPELEPEVAGGLRETLRVLVALPRAGRHPLRKGRHCGYCPYARACRKEHPATLERVFAAGEHRDWRDLAKKQKKKPTLDDARGESSP